MAGSGHRRTADHAAAGGARRAVAADLAQAPRRRHRRPAGDGRPGRRRPSNDEERIVDEQHQEPGGQGKQSLSPFERKLRAAALLTRRAAGDYLVLADATLLAAIDGSRPLRAAERAALAA